MDMWLCIKYMKKMLTNLLQSTNESNETHTNSTPTTGSGSARMMLQRPYSLPLGDSHYNRNITNSIKPQNMDRQTSTMNTLSSNSSEEEILSSHHALYIVKGTFLKDFDLRDVHLHDLFTEYELKYINAGIHRYEQYTPQILSTIMQEGHREEQVSRLFAVLRHKETSKIRKFMDSLVMDHDWLVNNFENVSKIDYSMYVDLVHALHSKVHLKYDDYNIHRSIPFRKLRNALLAMPPDGRVVLASDFGCGKKWLAIDACTDFDVAKAMSYQIHWIDMSQCTSSLEDLRMLCYLKLLLTESTRSPSPASYGSLDRAEPNTQAYRNSIAEVKQAVSVELKRQWNKKCLVVLVNVQNTHALKAFDLPCKLLVITRSKKVSDSFARSRSTTVRLNYGLTLEEVYILFEKYLENQKFKESNVDLIFTHSNGHPYLLSLIGQSLRQKSSNWQSWIDKLRESDLVDEKFNAAIEKSLDSLELELRQTFLKVFRCFPQAIFVPKEVIAALWPQRKCEKDLEKLHRHGFLEKFTTTTGNICYKLPFIYGKLKETKEVSSKDDIVDMHKKLLQYYHFVEDLDARKEVLPFKRDIHDFYFFLCIGYHLKKSHLTHYFCQLYLDYGFLEQKMRTVDLLSTIADLETFRHFIAPDSERRKAFRAIREFLPNIEKTLQESESATLLQCALMEKGLVGFEARSQAAAFPDFTWFEQRGCYHQRHNIVPLPSAPTKVILLDHERSLIAMEQSKSILLINTSLNWNSYLVKLKDPMQVKTKVQDIRFFNDNNSDILLVLYDNGDMKVWCIPEESDTDRRRSDSFVRPQEKEIECSNVIPRIYSFKPICAFDLSCSSVNGKLPILYMAHKTGEVNHIQWKSETKTFETASIPPLKTDMRDICIVRLVFHRNYIVGTIAGDVRIYEAIDYSHPRGLEPFRHFIEAIELSRNEQLLICRHCIVRFTSKSINQTGPVDYLLHENDLSAVEKCNVINCAKLLYINGRKQLVLGTNSGLIIFDIETRTKVLTTNVNEKIVCVDVHPLDNIKYKYMVACGASERKYLNLFALRVDASGGYSTLEWSHRSKGSCAVYDRNVDRTIDLQMAPDVWLKGGKLFAAQYVGENESTLLAVDSQNQLHKIDANGHSKLMQLPYTITAITLYGVQAVVGCANGQLFDLTAPAPLITAAFKDEAIEFLQLLDQQTLIAASATEMVIFKDFNESNVQQPHQQQFQLSYGKIKRCFRLTADRIVVVFESRVFWILNDSTELLYKYNPKGAAWFGDCDLQNKQLFIVSANYKIEVFDLDEQLPMEPQIIYYGTADISSEKRVSCIAVSRNAKLFAVACYECDANGESDVSIDVFECQLPAKCIEFLYRLNGHHRPINAMRFSPNAHVLVSCGEQMCWWSMQMAACKLNNTLAAIAPSRKHNSRFHSAESTDSSFSGDDDDDETMVDASVERNIVPKNIFEEVSSLPHKDARPLTDITPVDDDLCRMSIADAGDAVWKTKRGPDTHCELLSCIKFNGSEAQQFFTNDAFTQFQTIDNGGGYYVLTLRDYSVSQPMSLTSPLHKSYTMPVPYKTELSINESEYGEGGVDVVT